MTTITVETNPVASAVETTLTISSPTREEARMRFAQISESVRDMPGVRVLSGYRRIEIGERLIIKVLSER